MATNASHVKEEGVLCDREPLVQMVEEYFKSKSVNISVKILLLIFLLKKVMRTVHIPFSPWNLHNSSPVKEIIKLEKNAYCVSNHK